MEKEKEIQTLFGVSEKEVSATKDITPTLEISKFIGDDFSKNVVVTFLDNEPKEITYKDKETEKEEKAKVIAVECLGVEYSLWLSAKSLAIPIAKLYTENKGLKGLSVRIGKRVGTHKKYGDVKYYTVQRVVDKHE